MVKKIKLFAAQVIQGVGWLSPICSFKLWFCLIASSLCPLSFLITRVGRKSVAPKCHFSPQNTWRENKRQYLLCCAALVTSSFLRWSFLLSTRFERFVMNKLATKEAPSVEWSAQLNARTPLLQKVVLIPSFLGKSELLRGVAWLKQGKALCSKWIWKRPSSFWCWRSLQQPQRTTAKGQRAPTLDFLTQAFQQLSLKTFRHPPYLWFQAVRSLKCWLLFFFALGGLWAQLLSSKEIRSPGVHHSVPP